MTAESIKRAIRTAIVVTLALWIPGLIGFLNAITEWAKSEGSTPFPDAHGLAYLGVVAIVGGFTGLVQWLVNAIEDAIGHGFLRTVPARPARGEAGRAAVPTWLVVLLVVVAVVIVFAVLT